MPDGRIMSTAMGSRALNERPTTLSATTSLEISRIQTFNSLFLPVTKLSLAITDSPTSIYKRVSVKMNELVPFVRLKNIDPTGPGYVKAMLSSRVCHLYVVFGQYGVEKPSVGLLVNYHEPLRFPGCRDNHGCEIGYNTGSERDPTNDIDFAPFGGDLTKLRGAKVAFQFPFTDAYKGPNSLRVGDLFNILRGSYDSLPIEHHTNLTRFKLVTDGSENLWNQRGVRDLM